MSPRYQRTIAEQHLKAIGKKHGIAIHWIGGRGWIHKAMAYHDGWRVDIPRPYSQQQYLVALHEFGHLLGPITTDSRRTLNITEGDHFLLGEMGAWMWASNNISAGLHEAIQLDLFVKLVGDALTAHLWDMSVLASGQGSPV